MTIIGCFHSRPCVALCGEERIELAQLAFVTGPGAFGPHVVMHGVERDCHFYAPAVGFNSTTVETS